MVPGTGKLAKERSKPGYGWPGDERPAPLSNRTRIGSCASKAAWASLVGRLQLDRVRRQGHRPSIPIAAWKMSGARGLDQGRVGIGACWAT